MLATRRRIVLVAAAAALAACSPGDPPAAAPATASTTTAPTTTIAATTTAAAPTTTEDPEVAAVRQAHLDYLAMFQLVGDPPDPDHPELARTATGDAYERLRANLAQRLLEGKRMVGSWDSSIESIDVNGDQATVVDCALDGLELLAPDGSVVIPADSERYRLTSRLQKVYGEWRVWRLEDTDPPEPCSA